MSVDHERQIIDVEYHTDGIVEKDVPFARVKLASHRYDHSLDYFLTLPVSSRRDILRSGFLQNISEILHKIADITSNKDFQSRVLTSVDFVHVQQMMEHHVFGLTDLFAILDTIVTHLGEIQSEIRKKEYLLWYREKTAAHRLENLSSLEEKGMDDEGIRMNSVILFLPTFFEMTMARLDELQLEVTSVLTLC